MGRIIFWNQPNAKSETLSPLNVGPVSASIRAEDVRTRSYNRTSSDMFHYFLDGEGVRMGKDAKNSCLRMRDLLKMF